MKKNKLSTITCDDFNEKKKRQRIMCVSQKKLEIGFNLYVKQLTII